MKKLLIQSVLLLSAILIISSRKKEKGTAIPPYVPPLVQPVLLKEFDKFNLP